MIVLLRNFFVCSEGMRVISSLQILCLMHKDGSEEGSVAMRKLLGVLVVRTLLIFYIPFWIYVGVLTAYTIYITRVLQLHIHRNRQGQRDVRIDLISRGFGVVTSEHFERVNENIIYSRA